MSELWSSYHEKLLKKWAEMSKTYSIMHSLCAEYYSTWHKRLGVPVVIIGGITASSIFSSSKEQDDIWIYINGGLALLMTVLSGVSNFLGMSEKTIKHQTASYKYTKIAMDIDTLLSFSRSERSDKPQEFIQMIKTAILEIRENVPELLPWVMGGYLKKFDKSLTDTRSKINRRRQLTSMKRESPDNDSHHHETQTQPITTQPFVRQRISTPIPTKTGVMLSDFNDRQTRTMYNLAEQMQSCQEVESDDDSVAYTGRQASSPNDEIKYDDSDVNVPPQHLLPIVQPRRPLENIPKESNRLHTARSEQRMENVSDIESGN